MMTDVECITRAKVAFIVPVHPGNAPVHAANATGSAITETIRLFNVNVNERRLCKKFTAESKQQLLKAFNACCLQVLKDQDFGFADISPHIMLVHLQVTPDDLEESRKRLSANWNPDNPIEEVSI
jgi:hypothetical protein